KCVLATRISQELAVFVVGAFGYHNCAVTVFLDTFLDLLQEGFFVEGDFREHNYMRSVTFLLRSQTGSASDPARVTSHDFHHKHLGGAFAHGGYIKAGFTDGYGDVFGNRAKTGAVVSNWQIVVHGF